MSKVAIQGNASGTGVFTIASPNSNTDRTLTLPDEAGTVLTSASTTVLPKGNSAFRAYLSSAYNISSGTFTKITLDAEDFDLNNEFDTSNSRFTPTVAGYYWISAAFANNGASSPSRLIARLHKNGSVFSFAVGDQVTGYTVSGGKLMYFNGATDYVELYGYIIAGTAEVSGAEMSGYLVRAA